MHNYCVKVHLINVKYHMIGGFLFMAKNKNKGMHQEEMNHNNLAEMGEDLMEAANHASQEVAHDVKKGLKKTRKQVSKTLKKASKSIDKMMD